MHEHLVEIISLTKKSGIDVALTTNAVLLNESLSERILGDMEWIKISINAATMDAYAKIHRTKAEDFDKVIKNLSSAVRIKQDNKYKCTLGMQIILLPENKNEIISLAEIAKNIGMDYLVVKPYSQHPFSKTDRYKDVKYNEYVDLSEKLSEMNTKDFSVIFRMHAMKKWDEGKRNYNQCFALPFWSYIDAGGGVWGCSAYLGDSRFYYGNIYQNSFKDIWEGEKRHKSVCWVENELDINECRTNCRMDEINRYLWKLTHPDRHVNFI